MATSFLGTTTLYPYKISFSCPSGMASGQFVVITHFTSGSADFAKLVDQRLASLVTPGVEMSWSATALDLTPISYTVVI